MDRVISLLAALVGLIALGGAILVHTNGDTQRNQMAAQIAQLKVSVDLLTQQTAGGRTALAPASVPSVEPPISEYVAAEVPSSSELPSLVLPSSSEAPPSSSASSVTAPAPLEPLTPPSSKQPASSSEPPIAAFPASSAEGDSQIAQVKVLQDRIASLERTMADQAAQLQAAKAAPSLPAQSIASSAEVAAIPSSPSGATPAAVTADGPTKDCIPIGTRFMASSGDSFPICKTKVVVKVASVSDGFASITGPGDIAAGASGDLAKGCNIMVFSADTTGFAEMRVNCQ